MPAIAPVPSVRQLVVAKRMLLAAEMVRGLPPGQLAPEPLHTWPVTHTLLPHDVPAVTNPSVGQVADEPVQFSATSHTPADGRHTSVAGWKASAGQEAELPVQFSARSQKPADGRHTVVDGANPSAGQLAEV